MRQTRVYSPQSAVAGSTITLEAQASRHLLKVLRLKAGDAVTLFNGQGEECSASIVATEQQRAALAVGEWQAVSRESPLQVTLNQAVGRGERMDYAIQKAVELGVTAIRPVFTERTVVALSGERLAKRMAHWQGVIVAACEQSGRNRLPELLPAVKTAELSHSTTAHRLLLNPQAGQALAALTPNSLDFELLIGPEGGLSDAEIQLLSQAGWQGIQLGPRVLRTETAALAVLAAMQCLWGDF